MSEVLQPGTQIKPVLSVEEAKKLAEHLYGLSVAIIKELDAYDDKNYHIEVQQDKIKEGVWPHGFVLKIMNSLDSKKTSFIDAQNQMMLYLSNNGIRCTRPVKNLKGHLLSVEQINGGQHIVRLLEFQPGEILYNVKVEPDLCLQSGCYLADINKVLTGFEHPAYKNHSTIWALDSVPKLVEFLFAVKDDHHNNLAGKVIQSFNERVMPVVGNLPKGMIHGDFNEHNILVREYSGKWMSDGILDFGDTQYNCYLFEVALAACYMMLMAKDTLEPIRAGVLVIAGYLKKRPLSTMELGLMRVCICARLSQSLVLGLYSHAQDPTNTYVLQTAKSGSGWKILEQTWNMTDEEFGLQLELAINFSLE